MSALWWVLCWRALGVLLRLVVVLAGGVLALLAGVRRLRELAEVEMLLALAWRRTRGTRAKCAKGARR